MFSLLYRRSFRNAKYVHMASRRGDRPARARRACGWTSAESSRRIFAAVQFRDVKSVEIRQGAEPRRAHGSTAGTRLHEGELVDRVRPRQRGEQSHRVGRPAASSPDAGVIGGGHLHNLYLALPMLYGWTGAIAYVLMLRRGAAAGCSARCGGTRSAISWSSTCLGFWRLARVLPDRRAQVGKRRPVHQLPDGRLDLAGSWRWRRCGR